MAACGTATYNLAKKFAALLRPLVGSSGRNLRNTSDLITAMEEVELQEDEVLASFDVKSLFTSIPVEEAIEICRKRLELDTTLKDRTTMDVQTIIELLRFCVTSTSFQYNNKHYKQIDGLAMGSPISPFMADIFMEEFEEKAFADETIRPKLWKRYVDDVISVIKRSMVQTLLSHLNTQHPHIIFTIEEERNGSLPFMDVRFTKMANGELQREVYRKPTHTDRYVQYHSHHPVSVKTGLIDCLMERARNVSSSEEIFKKEKRHIQDTLQQNGYPKSFINKAIVRQEKRTRRKKETEKCKLEQATIPYVEGMSQEIRRLARLAGIRCTFFTPDTTNNLYRVKDQLPTGTKTHAVYSITCGTCQEEYIGETLRAIDVRRKEHRNAIRLGQPAKSAIAEHVFDHPEHVIDWEDTKVIDVARKTRERKIREALHIEQKKPRMNRDKGVERSTSWDAIL